MLIAGLSDKAKALGNLSAFAYTCLHDTEMECDGLFNYDRSPKFRPADLELIRAANEALVGPPVTCQPLVEAPASGWPRWMFA